MGSSLRNLGLGSPDDSPASRPGALGFKSLTPAMAAKAQAYLFVAAAVVGATGVLLPHPPRFDELGMLAVQLMSAVAAGLLLLLRERIPGWVITAGPYAAVAGTSAVLVLTHSSTSPYLLFYMWVAFYAFNFLPARQAMGLALFTVASYVVVALGFRTGAVSSPGSNSDEDISAIVLLAGTVGVAGMFILRLRERVGGLIGQLSDAATSDSLTGLLNRRAFQQVLENEAARAARNGQPFSLVVGDCDHFKDLNDSEGHQSGDEALLTIARLLERDRRKGDVAARIGGEEFALVLPETGQHEAYLVAERMRMRIAETFSTHATPLTMSFGVATYPVHAEGDDGLLRLADDALYGAKALGRDRSVLYSSEIAGILAAERDGGHQRDKAQLTTVLNLAEALDMRDSGTARHSQTVGRYCELMARELGLAPERIERVRVAGVLHDIGKIGVADSILCKAGPLTADEYDAMKKHPEIGARILGGSNLDDIRGWVLAHHERPDGLGYPLGSSGEDIPLEARILAVADAYEAMTSDRVYRGAIGPEAARAELLRWAGRQFDAAVVEAFLEALDRVPGRTGLSVR